MLIFHGKFNSFQHFEIPTFIFTTLTLFSTKGLYFYQSFKETSTIFLIFKYRL